MRLLTLDIETRPAQAYVWGLWDQNISIDKIIDSGGVICWSARWYGEKTMMFSSVQHQSQKKVIKGAWNLLDKADAVIHYNGRSFDIPELNTEFAKLGFTPPSPYKQIDLILTAKKQFRFLSNKLEFVASELGVGHKVKHTGFDLWKKCMDKDPKAWSLMEKYNKQDVSLLEDLYTYLLPWIEQHPNVSNSALIEGNIQCPSCGSENYQERGVYHAKTRSYKRYKCNNCQSWFRSTLSESNRHKLTTGLALT